MIQISPIVRNLLIVNVIVFILQTMLPQITMLGALYPMESPYFQPYQFVTYLFLHGDWRHLFGNMLSLWMFGSMIEQVFGSQRFLSFYFITGIGAGILHTAATAYDLSQIVQIGDNAEFYNRMLSIPTLGASGAIFGILAAYGFIFPNRLMQLMFIPVPIKAIYLVILFAVIEFRSGIWGVNTGIAHFAHLGGMVFAMILLKMWQIRRIE
jgi:membrane associated rhomboid family serine protease